MDPAGQRAKELLRVAAHAGRRRREGAAVEADAEHGAMLAAVGRLDHHAPAESTGRIDIDRKMYRMPQPAV